MLGRIFHRDTKAATTSVATTPPTPAPTTARPYVTPEEPIAPAAPPAMPVVPVPVTAKTAAATPLAAAGLPVPEHPAETVRFQARHPSSIGPNKTVLASALAAGNDWTNPLPTANPRRRAITKTGADTKPPAFAAGDAIGDAAAKVGEQAGPAAAPQEEL
jgi:hypothetical protein